MILKHIDALKKTIELTTTKTNYVLPYSGLIDIQRIKDKIIYINGEAIDVDKDRLFHKLTNVNIQIEGDNQIFNIKILSSEHQQETILDYILFGKAFNNNKVNGTIDNEILFTSIEDEEIEDLKISICTFNRKFKKIKEKKDIDAILDCTKKLPHIFYRPKIHLNQVSEIRPASVVSRIGLESISHLASHSEHWKGIKASGLVPERLLARVLEDDYAIYENIAVKSLVDKLYELEKKEREENIDISMQTEADDGHSLSFEQKNYFNAMKVLLKGMDEEDAAFMHDILDEQKRKVDKILDILIECRETPLYRTLKRQKAIRGKLKKTNIFMMDHYYKYAYKLWNILNNSNEVSTLSNLVDISNEYALYCKVLFLFSLKYFNFNPDDLYGDVFVEDSFGRVTYNFKDWSIRLENIVIRELDESGFKMILSRKDEIIVNLDGIQLPTSHDIEIYNYVSIIENNLIFTEKISDEDQLNFINDVKIKITKDKGKQKKWASDMKQRLYIKFYNYESKEKTILFVPWKFRFENIAEEIRIALTMLKQNVSNYKFDECYIMTISRPSDYSNVEDASIINGMIDYGWSDEDKFLKASNIGVIPIGVNDINSYRRFTKIILKNMIMLDEEHEDCPICGKKIIEGSNGVLYCGTCNFQIIHTQCSYCKEKYVFTRYDLSKTNSYKKGSPGLEVLIRENSLGYKNITNAVILDGQLNPICPNCGK